MYDNLRTALRQKGISIKQYAEVLGAGEKTVQNKLTGRTDFTYPEFRKTCALLFEYNADYLFAEKASRNSPKQTA
ncbi:MAG: DNA-binding protein [Lachnospiraceae bacterium]|nr:DNA-binding protein [Lachnospiraceae bacterium]